jgi:hypothetical protein
VREAGKTHQCLGHTVWAATAATATGVTWPWYRYSLGILLGAGAFIAGGNSLGAKLLGSRMTSVFTCVLENPPGALIPPLPSRDTLACLPLVLTNGLVLLSLLPAPIPVGWDSGLPSKRGPLSLHA